MLLKVSFTLIALRQILDRRIKLHCTLLLFYWTSLPLAQNDILLKEISTVNVEYNFEDILV